MKIIFTLCSNNYLAQAKTLGDSIKRTNPDYEFFIGLTDKLNPEIDYPTEIGHTIIPSDEIGIPDFDSLWKKYSIIEFNTCVKPFYFQYLIKRYSKIDYLFYLDPDTCIFGNMGIIEQEFGETGKTLLTPHITTPLYVDDKKPNENLFLKYGIYNLGFLGLKNPEKNNELLEWWQERTYHSGYNQTPKGLFVDQLWFNQAPLFFDNIVISKNPGFNMAPWNLHERKLIDKNDIISVNNSFPLIFYHFSNYKYTEPNILTRIYDRYSFQTNPDLKSIYTKYHALLIENGIEKLSKIKCHYMILRKNYFDEQYQRKIKNSKSELIIHYLKKITPPLGIRIFKAIKN